MKNFEEYRITNNRYVYNRIRKQQLEKTGKIRCAWCSYNGGENSTKKWYGSKFNIDKFNAGFEELIEDVRWPSWKLVSKNKKQWMNKGINIIEKERRYLRGPQKYIEIKF
jgi:hypothetical protein